MQQRINVIIEKTKLALSLEKKLEISWDLSQGYSKDAGYDLRATILKNWYIRSNTITVVPIGLHFQLPNAGWEIQIRPRSGLAAKKGIMVVNSPGTIDFNYREEVMVILYNTGVEAFKINPGDRIAQACIREVPAVKFKYNKVERTARGGFGSTGIN